MQTITNTIQNIEIENLTGYPLYFKRLTGNGDIKLKEPSNFPDFIPFDELQEQIRANNKMFTGIDGRGNHARIRIVDEEIRKSLFNSVEGETVELLTLGSVKELLAISQPDEFMKRLEKLVVTDAEKRMILNLAQKAGVNEVAGWKGRAIESFIERKPDESYWFVPLS